MNRITLLLVVFFALVTPVKAIAPVLAFVATTSAGTTTISAASTAVGLALSALAVLSTTTNPVKISFPTTDGKGAAPTTFLFAANDAATSGQLSGTCRIYNKRVVYFTNIGTLPYDWTAGSTTSCSNYSTAANQSVDNTCGTTYPSGATPGCSHLVIYRKLQCISTANCSLINNGQVIEPTSNQTVDEQQKVISHASTNPDNNVKLEYADSSISYDTNDPQIPATVGGETGFPAPTSTGGMALEYSTETGQRAVAVQQPVSGGYTLSEYIQQPDATVSVAQMSVSGNGTVSTHSTSSQSGYVNPVPATSPLSPIVYAPITQSNPDTGTDPGTGTGGQTEFPSDYAKSGEAAAAAQNVVDGLLSGEVVTPEVPDIEMPWFGATFDGVLPTINTAGATCPVWQFEALGESFYIDHHCQLIADFNALFYAIFTAFWSLLAFRTVLEA